MKGLVKLWRELYYGSDATKSLALGEQVQSLEDIPMPKCMEQLMKKRGPGLPPEFEDRKIFFRYLASLGQDVPTLVKRRWPKAQRDVFTLAQSYQKTATARPWSCTWFLERGMCPHLKFGMLPSAALAACHGPKYKGAMSPTQYSINRAKVVIEMEVDSKPPIDPVLAAADEIRVAQSRQLGIGAKPQAMDVDSKSQPPPQAEISDEFMQIRIESQIYEPACPPDSKAATDEQFAEAATRVIHALLGRDSSTHQRTVRHAILTDLGSRGIGVRVSDWRSRFESVFNEIANAWMAENPVPM